MDWDKAYDNRASVTDFGEYLEKWKTEAAQFRDEMSAEDRCRLSLSYAPRERNVADLFMPKSEVKGLVIYVHGGYWRALDKSYWSHLSKGALEDGWAFAVPSYTLAPQARISEITQEIAKAIAFLAREVPGEIRLIGHSAGGHLVARMICETSDLPLSVSSRIAHTVAVSGVFDLEHLPKTEMNNDLRIDEAEIASESPARLKPVSGKSITCLVGGNELAEFQRQNTLLEPWQSNGVSVATVTSTGHHHFNVVEPLQERGSEILRLLLEGGATS